MKTLSSIFSIALLWLCASSTAGAINIVTGETVTIREHQNGNLYLGGSNVSVEAPVYGNVTVGGGTVRLLDTIGQDLTVAAGKVDVRGPVLGDVRGVGGQLYLYSAVSGDVVVAGGELEVGPDAVITGDLVVTGGTVRVYGRVQGAVVLVGGTVRFTGIAEREAEFRGGSIYFDGTVSGPAVLVGETVELGAASSFIGPVRYWRKQGELDFGPYLRGGQAAVFDPALATDMRQQQANWFRGFIGFFFFWRLLAASLTIVVLVLLFRPFFERIGGPLRENWLSKFGSGILYLIGVPLLVVLALMTVIGIPLALFALFLYVFSLAFAHALTAVLAACAWERYRGYQWSNGQVILAAIGIFVLLKMIGWIPVAGLLVSIVVVGVAFGALAQGILQRRQPAPMAG